MFVFPFFLHCFSYSSQNFTVFSEPLLTGEKVIKSTEELNPVKTDVAHSRHSKYIHAKSDWVLTRRDRRYGTVKRGSGKEERTDSIKKRRMSRWEELITCARLHQLINSKPKNVETFVTTDFVTLHLCSQFLSCGWVSLLPFAWVIMRQRFQIRFDTFCANPYFFLLHYLIFLWKMSLKVLIPNIRFNRV